MTGMLASVNSMDEANIVMAANVDIIDLKEPALGALGGLDISLVKKLLQSSMGNAPPVRRLVTCPCSRRSFLMQ